MGGRPVGRSMGGRPVVLGIGGGSGAGKSTLAQVSGFTSLIKTSILQSILGALSGDGGTSLVELDRFYRAGDTVEVPEYNFGTHSRVGWSSLASGDVIVFAGVLSLAFPPLNFLFDLRVFVDTDEDIRLQRRLNRDTMERGRSVDGVLKQYHRYVKPAYDAFIAPTRKVADIIVEGGCENEMAVSIIANYIRTELCKREIDIRE